MARRLPTQPPGAGAAAAATRLGQPRVTRDCRRSGPRSSLSHFVPPPHGRFIPSRRGAASGPRCRRRREPFGATIERVETDADGNAAYEAHMVKSDGTRVTVYVNKSFEVVSVESGP